MWLIRNCVFTICSIATAISCLLVFPFDYRKSLTSLIVKAWSNLTIIIYGVKVDVYGAENAAENEGKIYVSNHLSYFDIFVLLAKLPGKVRIIYKKELNRMPLISWAMMASGFQSIDRKNIRSSLESLDKAAKKIKNGLSFVIFPEGTRSETGDTLPFKRGMFVLTEKAERDFIPVSLWNTHNITPNASLRVRPGRVILVMGKPMKSKSWNDKEFVNEVRDLIISNIKKF